MNLQLPSTALLAAVLLTGVVVSGCSSTSSTTTETVGSAGRASESSARPTPSHRNGGDALISGDATLTEDGIAGDPGPDSLSNGLPAPSAGEGAATGAPEGPDASDQPDPRLSGRPVPTRPPGDGTPGEEDGTSEEGDTDPSRPRIADTALLDATTVGDIVGGTWTTSSAGAIEGVGAGAGCPLPGDSRARATSTRTMTAAGAASVVERLTVFRGAAEASASLAPTVRTLEACGFRASVDPRLGDASAHLVATGSGPHRRAVLVAAEGVTVVLLLTDAATGPQPTTAGSWESLADLALGSSCSAAVDGCH